MDDLPSDICHMFFLLALIIVLPVGAEITNVTTGSSGNEKYFITIDPVGDKTVGDTFTITSITNLGIGRDVLVQIYHTSFHPGKRGHNDDWGGAIGTVKVVKGYNDLNRTEFEVNTTDFIPADYIVTEETVNQTTRGHTLFNVLPRDDQAPSLTTVRMAGGTKTISSVSRDALPTTAFGFDFLLGLGAFFLVMTFRK